jgi:hypothetical protein
MFKKSLCVCFFFKQNIGKSWLSFEEHVWLGLHTGKMNLFWKDTGQAFLAYLLVAVFLAAKQGCLGLVEPPHFGQRDYLYDALADPRPHGTSFNMSMNLFCLLNSICINLDFGWTAVLHNSPLKLCGVWHMSMCSEYYTFINQRTKIYLS